MPNDLGEKTAKASLNIAFSAWKGSVGNTKCVHCWGLSNQSKLGVDGPSSYSWTELDLGQNNNGGTNLNTVHSPTAIQIILTCSLSGICNSSRKQMNIPLCDELKQRINKFRTQGRGWELLAVREHTANGISKSRLRHHKDQPSCLQRPWGFLDWRIQLGKLFVHILALQTTSPLNPPSMAKCCWFYLLNASSPLSSIPIAITLLQDGITFA